MSAADSRSVGADIGQLADRIAAGDRATLARAITLVESRREDHRRQAAHLIEALQSRTGGAVRVGITGVPGVGKSTLIDRLGMNLIAAGHRVAVLAVDPSSVRTGGSLLADKTRMPRLAAEANAFVRPSPAAGTLGGVAARTREAMLLCEAAGFDVVIVETLGTGQSEVAVADMVDVFVLLMLPGAGDELQGLKKGVVELADVIAVNKAEGTNAERARAAAADLSAALRILSSQEGGPVPPVLTVSGFANEGLDRLWEEIVAFCDRQQAASAFERRRASQAVLWFHALLAEEVQARLFAKPQDEAALAEIEQEVRDGRMNAAAAVRIMLERAGL
jgi:LAO/AO transport system kinase